jgi:hypothetical protein
MDVYLVIQKIKMVYKYQNLIELKNLIDFFFKNLMSQG